MSKKNPAVARWAKDTVADENVMSALLELACSHRIAPSELLSFLEQLRGSYVLDKELRAVLRKLGRQWKAIERLSVRARRDSEVYLGEFKEVAQTVENAARFLGRFFTPPKARRPVDADIAECKADICLFLRRHGVRDVNRNGWILLKAVFGDRWAASCGRDQIQAFRKISDPPRGIIRTRADAERAAEKAKIELMKMQLQTEGE
jgi:hypothetical protein